MAEGLALAFTALRKDAPQLRSENARANKEFSPEILSLVASPIVAHCEFGRLQLEVLAVIEGTLNGTLNADNPEIIDAVAETMRGLRRNYPGMSDVEIVATLRSEVMAEVLTWIEVAAAAERSGLTGTMRLLVSMCGSKDDYVGIAVRAAGGDQHARTVFQGFALPPGSAFGRAREATKMGVGNVYGNYSELATNPKALQFIQVTRETLDAGEQLSEDQMLLLDFLGYGEHDTWTVAEALERAAELARAWEGIARILGVSVPHA